MKKSELRKIIRESVKGLMAEQSGPCDPTTHKRLRVKFCPGATNVLGDPMPTHSNSMIHCTQIDGQVPGPQHVGTIVEKPSNYNCFACTTYEVVEVLDDYHPQGMQMIGNLQTLPGCPINPNTPPTSGCDNTMAGSCAQNWLPSNMNWPNMANFACTGSQTYSAVEQSQLMGATNLLNSNGFTGTIPSFSNYQDISNFVNSTGIGQPQKGQIKRKLAKSHWGGCMFIDCNC